jgi:hypothetical protein
MKAKPPPLNREGLGKGLPEYVERRPWDQLQNESDTAYGGFVEWLHMPVIPNAAKNSVNGRNQRDLAEKISRKPQQITTWMKVYSWESRTLAYDEFYNNPNSLETRMEIKNFGQKLRQFSNTLLDKAIAAFEQVDPASIPMEDIAKYAKLGLQLGQVAKEIEQPIADREREGLVNAIRGKLATIASARIVTSASRVGRVDELGGDEGDSGSSGLVRGRDVRVGEDG